MHSCERHTVCAVMKQVCRRVQKLIISFVSATFISTQGGFNHLGYKKHCKLVLISEHLDG